MTFLSFFVASRVGLLLLGGFTTMVDVFCVFFGL